MALKEPIVNPAQLIGKLHLSGMKAVNDGWPGKINIANTAINVSKKNNPLAVMQDGVYEIVCTPIDGKMSVEEIAEPLETYLAFFIGRNDAKDAVEVALDSVDSSDLKNDGSLQVSYKMKTREGSKQSVNKAIQQQFSVQQKDLDGRENKDVVEIGDIDATTVKNVVRAAADSADVSESNPVVAAGKDPAKLSDEGFAKKVIDSISDMTKNSKEMDEKKMILVMNALKNFKDAYREEDIDLEEADGKLGTAAEIFDKYKKYFNSAMTSLSNTVRDTKKKGIIGKLFNVKISGDIMKSFAKDTYKWAENAVKKARDDFSSYFKTKTDADKEQEKSNKAAETQKKLNLRDLKKQVEKLTDFYHLNKSKPYAPIKAVEDVVDTYNRELKDKAKTNAELKGVKPTLKLKEISVKAGPETLKRFLDLAKGEFINSKGEKKSINDLLKAPKQNLQAMFRDWPQELVGWIPAFIRYRNKSFSPLYFKGKLNESAPAFTIDERTLFEAEARLRSLEAKALFESQHRRHMINLTEKFIEQVKRNKNVAAQSTLESILKQKMQKRIKDVLDEEKEKNS